MDSICWPPGQVSGRHTAAGFPSKTRSAKASTTYCFIAAQTSLLKKAPLSRFPMQEAGSGAKEFLPRYHPDDPHGGSLVVIPGNGDGPSRSSRAAPEWPVPFACRGLSPSPLAAGRLRQFAPSARLTEIFYHNLSACQGRLGTIRRKAWNHPAEALCEKTLKVKRNLHKSRKNGNQHK